MAHDYTFKLIGKSTESHFEAQVFRGTQKIGTASQNGYGHGCFAHISDAKERADFAATALAAYPQGGGGAEELFCSELAFMAELARKRKLVFIFDGGESDLHANMHLIREIGGFTREQLAQGLMEQFPGRQVAIFDKDTRTFQPV